MVEMVQLNVGHPIDFEEFAKAVDTIATESFMDDKKLPPKMFTFKDGVIQVAEIPFKKESTKSPLLIVGPVVEKYRPEYWGVAFEAWIKEIRHENEQELMRMAEEYRRNYNWGDIGTKEPVKREVIQIVAESLEGTKHYDRMYTIKRAYGQVKLKRYIVPNVVVDSETLPMKGGASRTGNEQGQEEEEKKKSDTP